MAYVMYVCVQATCYTGISYQGNMSVSVINLFIATANVFCFKQQVDVLEHVLGTRNLIRSFV